MKLFQATQIYFERIGYSPHHERYNRHHVTGFFVSFTGLFLNFMFLIHVAETVKEFTDSLYVVSAIVSTVLCFANTMHKTSELFAYFNQFEENVTTSRSMFVNSMNGRIFFISFITGTDFIFQDLCVEISHRNRPNLMHFVSSNKFIFVYLIFSY